MPTIEREKIKAGIYWIDLTRFLDDSFDAVIKVIIDSAKKENINYAPESIVFPEESPYSLRAFYKRRTSAPRWRGFLNKILAPGAVLRTAQNTNHDFLLFVKYEGKIFVITGGSGSFAIDRFVVQSFGIDILCRLIEKNSQVIKSVQERGVTGIVLGQSRFYRDDQRLSDESAFGKIYREVQAELNAKILKSIFGFKDSELKKPTSDCLAKSSFQISKSLTFDDFLRIIDKVSKLLDEEPNFNLNNVQLIAGKSQAIKTLKKNLTESLVQNLYEHYENDTEPDFDFCNKQFDKYLTASYYKVHDDEHPKEFETRPSLKQIFVELKRLKGHEVTDEYLFNQFILLASYVEAIDANGERVTYDCVLSHIHGEIMYNGFSYFLIDEQWYKVNPEFVEELNAECKQLLADAWDDVLITQPFSFDKERDFNESFVGKTNTLVFDTITKEKIEACDILIYTDTTLYLVHVKQGFDNSVRDLAGQIAIAARRIAQDKIAGFKYVDGIEERTKSGKRSNSAYRKKLGGQSFPQEGLKSLFLGKREINICFCLAFVDTSNDQRTLKDNIEKFNSNIAKYSLIEVRKGIRQYGFDFKVIQLKKA